MNILVTGNLGYIGSVLTEILEDKGHEVTGYDAGYFKDCELYPSKLLKKQIIKDIRNIKKTDLKDINAIIHLAGLSNDPLGDFRPGVTEKINLIATINLAKLAKENGVSRFVYASSQSMYGLSDNMQELDEEKSQKKPVTSYAKTKWESEIEIKKLNCSNFVVSCFRPSTVFGLSPRLRCDIVFNNFVACAFTTGKIEILSDGSPWRPVVHINDVCQAFLSGIEAPAEIIGGKAFNVGLPDGNFTVKKLAETAKKFVPKCELVYLNKHTDPRTYRVSFDRILNDLKDYYKPQWNLERGAKQLVDFFKRVNFKESDFRGQKYTRISQIKYLIENKIISEDLI